MDTHSPSDGVQNLKNAPLPPQFQQLVETWSKYIEDQEKNITEQERDALAFNAATVLALPEKLSLSRRNEVMKDAHAMLNLEYQVGKKEHFSFLQHFAKQQGIPPDQSEPLPPILHKRALVALVESGLLSRKNPLPLSLGESHMGQMESEKNDDAEQLALKLDLPPSKKRKKKSPSEKIAPSEMIFSQVAGKEAKVSSHEDEVRVNTGKMGEEMAKMAEEMGKNATQYEKRYAQQKANQEEQLSFASVLGGKKKKKMSFAAAAGWGTGGVIGAVWLGSGGDDSSVALLQTAMDMFC